MRCEFCPQEAVDRCYTCGSLFCQEHGKVNCQRCRTAFVAGDPRPDRISAVRLTPLEKPAWWRPQPAEDYDPPACYECQGLARTTCRHCQRLYCAEHAGKPGLCRQCTQSVRVGNWVVVGFLALVLFLILFGWQQGLWK